MGTQLKSVAIAVALACLAGCGNSTGSVSGQAAASSAPSPSGSSISAAGAVSPISPLPIPTPTRIVDDLDAYDTEIHLHPRKWGIREYVVRSGDADYPSKTSTWLSSVGVTGSLEIDWTTYDKVTIYPVCNTPDGLFNLYKNGRNVASGPCGPTWDISFGLPQPKPRTTITYTYKVINADKAEVAAYMKKPEN